METKQCRRCQEIKVVLEFRIVDEPRKRNLEDKWRHICKECERKISREWKKRNSERNTLITKTWRAENIEHRKEYSKKYSEENREHLSAKKAEHDRNKRNTNPSFKLRQYVSVQIGNALKAQGGSKMGHSVLEFLPYNIEQLRTYLENQFEPWMNWKNYGKYNSSDWNDNDQTTWKWQIDHIIPRADLPFNSMSDENFKKCWALENLRPYSAKQNIIDGATKIRHKKQ